MYINFFKGELIRKSNDFSLQKCKMRKLILGDLSLNRFHQKYNYPMITIQDVNTKTIFKIKRIRETIL